jgi:hypothetical protein
MLMVIGTECKIFFCDSQGKNAKKVEITEFYYQQNNQQVFNIRKLRPFNNSALPFSQARSSVDPRLRGDDWRPHTIVIPAKAGIQ